jgi:hypothetical protein
MNKKGRFDMDLQWFADGEPIPEIEEELDLPEDDVEYVFYDGDKPPEPEPEEDPEVTKLREENESLKNQVDPLNVIREGLGNLASKEQNVSARNPVPSPVATPNQVSEEEFSKKLDEELFKTGQTFPVLKEAIMRVVSPMVQQVAANQVVVTKATMRNDPNKPYFEKYEAEIDNLIANAPPETRSNPNILELAYNNVVSQHMPEIIASEVEKAKEDIKAELQAETPKAPAKAVGVSSRGVRSNAASSKKQVHVSKRIQRMSAQGGLPIATLLEMEKEGLLDG